MTLRLTILRPSSASGGADLPPAPHGQRRLIDSHGREIRDLRLSITDRCNFRCTYCMDPDVAFLPREDLLSDQEMVRLAGIAVGLGIRKIRLTGGEPTIHPGLDGIIAGIASTGVHDLAMTTNGSRLELDRLRAWRDAGLTRLTVSIDSIQPGRFAAITRSRSSPAAVVDGIRAAQRAGFARLKLNAVIVRGFNEDEVVPLASLARDLGVEMRYIEYMPLDSGRHWNPSLLVPASEIVDRIGAVYPIVPAGRDAADSTSLSYQFADLPPGEGSRIGVIAPVSRPFCGACSRLRITADGKVRPCLFSLDEFDVRPLLRGGRDDEAIAGFLVDAIWTKQAGHGINTPAFTQPDRPMSAIGG
ncbi:MAG: GTP 3',8-cyclase MoaA [Phycisphaeraceae bacterium]|nr:GTP 3',8-cyclase MoaA [Phycisphaeraceae bacterium]